MSLRQLQHFAKIRHAKEATLQYAKRREVPLVHIEHVATFEDWDQGIEVWFFFDTDIQCKECEVGGIFTQLSNFYRQTLQEDGYDFDDFPEVLFHMDSKQNVDSKFEGNYFYRVR